MKKSIITPLLLLLAIGASAQLRIDLRAGASAAQLGEERLTMGLRGGVAVSRLFGGKAGIRTGLFYTDKGATSSDNPFEYGRSLSTRLSYIELPVEAVGGFRLSEHSRFELHGGLSFGCLVRSKYAATADWRADRWEVGAGFGFDFVVRRFIVGPEVQYGLTRLSSSGSLHNTTYSLTVGYRF